VAAERAIVVSSAGSERRKVRRIPPFRQLELIRNRNLR
jgi:hypothetical protein